MGEHSVIAPSSAHIFGPPNGCRAYPHMAAMFPQEETEAARIGTATHELGAQMISALARAGLNCPKREEVVGTVAANSVIYDNEMYDGAEMYAQDVAEVMRQTDCFNPHVEAKIYAARIHELSWGTTDCWLYSPKHAALYVWDFKFGHGVVEAFENWQSINYTAGILDQLQIDGISDQYLTVIIRIVQPRAYHREGPIREWKLKASDLRGYFNQLKLGVEESLGLDPVARSGPHCKHCPARHACGTALLGGWQLYEAATAPQPQLLSPEALGVQLAIIKRARKHLEAIETGYEAQVSSSIRSGNAVAGWSNEETLGRQKWNKPLAEVFKLGDLLGKNLRKETAITPKQAIKLGLDASLINAYSAQSHSGYKLVPDDTNKAQRIFKRT